MTHQHKGFSLIELITVIGIIGILAAIAIPQFSSMKIRAYNGTAASDLKNFSTKVQAFFTAASEYPNPVSGSGPQVITLTNGSLNITVQPSPHVSITLDNTNVAAKRCILAKHDNGDTIMYLNTDALSVKPYTKSDADVGVSLQQSSSWAAAQALACSL